MSNTNSWIITDRLKIRQALGSDSEFVSKVLTNEKVRQHMGGVIATFEETLSHIGKKPQLLNNFYIILLQNTCEKIGLISFPLNSEIKESELSIALMPLYCKKGYGSEALRSMRNFWLATNNTDHLYATVSSDNTDSISMLETNDFKYIKKYKERSTSHLLYKYEKNT